MQICTKNTIDISAREISIYINRHRCLVFADLCCRFLVSRPSGAPQVFAGQSTGPISVVLALFVIPKSRLMELMELMVFPGPSRARNFCLPSCRVPHSPRDRSPFTAAVYPTLLYPSGHAEPGLGADDRPSGGRLREAARRSSGDEGAARLF